jgi:uncharacterized protein YjeT (DUF2065 family)
MKDFATALALVLVIEGIAYLFADGHEAVDGQATALPATALRATGLAAACLRGYGGRGDRAMRMGKGLNLTVFFAFPAPVAERRGELAGLSWHSPVKCAFPGRAFPRE